eukprot:gene16309-22497_t
MEHSPEVASIKVRCLSQFCKDNGYQCRMEPTGSLLIPPSFNVTDTNWERSVRSNDQGQASNSFSGTSNDDAKSAGSLARYAGLGAGDIDFVRSQLEKLLPGYDSDDEGWDEIDTFPPGI